MAPLYVCLLIFTQQLMSVVAWNVTAQLNPGCEEHCDRFNIVYIRAENATSSAHCLFAAATRVSPSVLIIHSSDPTAVVHINWTLLDTVAPLEPVEAFLVDRVTQSYALTLYELIEYDDLHDKVDLSQLTDDKANFTVHSFKNWAWNLTSNLSSTQPHSLENDDVFAVTYSGNNSEPIFSNGGYIDLKFLVSNIAQHNPTMPRMQFVPGLTMQFEVSLVQLFTNFSQGRFGLRLGLVSNTSIAEKDDFFYSAFSSINDEVTPGIFEMVNLELDKRANASSNTQSTWPAGFLQTRPVCYTSDSNREIKNSRQALLSNRGDRVPDPNARLVVLNKTLPFLFYGRRISPIADDGLSPEVPNYVGLRIQNISFGTPEDGFYAGSNFIVWTASFGFGEPPMDNLSPLLIGLLSLSTVVVLGSLLFGTLLLFILRRRTHRGQFESLSETSSTAPLST